MLGTPVSFFVTFAFFPDFVDPPGLLDFLAFLPFSCDIRTTVSLAIPLLHLHCKMLEGKLRERGPDSPLAKPIQA